MKKIWINKVNDDALNHLILGFFLIWQTYLKHCSNLNTVALAHVYIEWNGKLRYGNTYIYIYIYIYLYISPVLSHFSPVQLFDTLWTVLLQALRLWDSPGENTGVFPPSSRGSSQCNPGIKPCLLCLLPWHARSLPLVPPESESEVAQLCPTLCGYMDCSLPGFSDHGIFQARVQGIFLTQGLNPGLLWFRQMLYHLSHQGSYSATWETYLSIYIYIYIYIYISLSICVCIYVYIYIYIYIMVFNGIRKIIIIP